MAVENIAVELTAPASGKPGAFNAGSGISSVRRMQCTLNDGTVVVDGVTYTRTSPLRTMQDMGSQGDKLDDNAAQDALTFQAPVVGSPNPGSTAIPIFSATGT